LHKRTLGPVKSLIYALKFYDIERTAACLDLSKDDEDHKAVGYMSRKARIYLVSPFSYVLLWFDVLSSQTDVHDHIEYAMASLDMYQAMAENLINYTFNVMSRVMILISLVLKDHDFRWPPTQPTK